MNTRPGILLEPATAQARVLVLVMTIGLPFFLTCIALAFAASKNTPMPNQIGNSTITTLLVVLLTQTLLTTGLWYFLNKAMSRHRIEWEGDRLNVLTSFYKQSYQRQDLQIDAASIVNLESDKEHRPFLKTNGYALPGFRSGWFRLRNRQSAFCAMAAGKQVLMLPTNKGHCLMLGISNPKKVLADLKQWAGEV